MSLILQIDTAAWNRHTAAVVARRPGIVPVAKGRGYGLGTDTVLGRCRDLARETPGELDLIAVGTYDEVPAALTGFDGEVLCLEPYRAAVTRPTGQSAALLDPRVVHTVTDEADLADLAIRASRPKVVLEGRTSMNRFGASPDGFTALLRVIGSTAAVDLRGASLHLPIGTGHEAEIAGWLRRAPEVATWYVSHVSPDELERLRAAHPQVQLRPRIGTELWLGAPEALTVLGDVLDVRPVDKGAVAGYRSRAVRGGHLVVVSGGTAHGVAMSAPNSGASARSRAIAVAEGVLEAAGRVRSPFAIGGELAWFVEPPHMQVSLVSVPEGTEPPKIGDRLPVRVRLTTALVDRVETR